jgi:quinol monooxygenase YgiN
VGAQRVGYYDNEEVNPFHRAISAADRGWETTLCVGTARGGPEPFRAFVPKPGGAMSEVELTIVTMHFDASDPDALQSVLAKYTVLTRMDPGCRNIDLCASVTSPGRFVIIQKWDSPTAQQAHFDGDVMVDMATACRGLLAHPPAIDLLESISAHDLK